MVSFTTISNVLAKSSYEVRYCPELIVPLVREQGRSSSSISPPLPSARQPPELEPWQDQLIYAAAQCLGNVFLHHRRCVSQLKLLIQVEFNENIDEKSAIAVSL
jgi:hypothetical protein